MPTPPGVSPARRGPTPPGSLLASPRRASPGRAATPTDPEAGTGTLKSALGLLATGGLSSGSGAARRFPLFLLALAVTLLMAVLATSDGASRADLVALGARVRAFGAGGAAAVRLEEVASLTRTRPAPPVDRPAGLPRSAFDAYMQPAMTPGEALTLAWYASQAGTYVEYGSGASTVQAAPLAAKALSIENAVPWCRQMQARADVAFWVAQGKLTYACVDIGETREWGMPANTSDKARWPDYVNAIDKLAAVVAGTDEDEEFAPPLSPAVVADVVLIDGRFRVATALKALWHIDDASVVLIHDWTPRAKAYGRVLAYYDKVDEVDELVVLARKKEIDWDAAAADLVKYMGVPARRAV